MHSNKIQQIQQTEIQQINKDVYVSETLDPSTVSIKDVRVHHESNELRRTVPIKNKEGKNYYVMTEYLEPDSVVCRSTMRKSLNNRDYLHYTFSLRRQKQNENKIIKDDSTDISEKLIKDNVQKLFENLNAFKRGLTNRIKYLMKIPEYSDDLSVSMTARTIKIKNTLLFNNIIEYNGLKNNFGFGHLKQIIKFCKNKLLIRIDGLEITAKNVYLNITLFRVYPESIDVLDSTTKLALLETLNTESVKNMEKYNDFNHIVKGRSSRKHFVKDELVRLLVNKKSDSKDKQKVKYNSNKI
jgi:hypothetical protein